MIANTELARTDAPAPAPADLPRTERRRARLAFWGGIAVLLLCTVAYFWRPLLTGRIAAPLDMVFDKNPWYAAPPEGFQHLQNGMMEDIAFEFYPIRQLAWSEWRHGRVPLWNPAILGGVPLLGADQYAVFDPLNLLTLPFPFPVSWLLVSMARVFLAGLGTYLFLLRLRLRTLPATFGAITFMFSSTMMIWLYWSHSDVTWYLPWLCWAVERLLSDRPWRLAPTFALAALVGGQFLAGHIEISVMVLITASLYLTWRVLAVARFAPRRTLAYLTNYAVGVSWGFILGAVQWVPAVLTVFRSAEFAFRQDQKQTDIVLPVASLSTWILPNIYGNPAHGVGQYFGIGNLNYNEHAGYAGLAALLAACWSWRGASATKNRNVFSLLLVLIVLAIGLVYAVPGLHLLAAIPPLNFIIITRFNLIICFALAILGAFGIQGLFFTRRPSSPVVARHCPNCGTPLPQSPADHALLLATRLVPWVPLALLGGVASAIRLAQVEPLSPSRHLFAGLFHVLDAGKTPRWLDFDLRWGLVAALIALVVWALLLVGLVARPQSRRARTLAAAGLIALAFGELTAINGSYNPSVPASWATITPPALAELQRLAGTTDRVTASPQLFPPNTGMDYGLRELRGLEPAESFRAGRYITDGREVTGRTLATPDAARLALANVAYFLTEGPVPRAKAVAIEGNNAVVGEIVGPMVVSQQFTPADDGLQGLALLTATYGHHLSDYPVNFVLTDRTTCQALVRQAFPGGRIHDNLYLYLHFPTLYGVAGHLLQLDVSAPDARPGDAPLIWMRGDLAVPGSQLLVDGHPAAGTLSFRAYYATPDSTPFELVWSDAYNAIWHNTQVRPRVYLASEVRSVATADEAFGALAGLVSPGPADPSRVADRPVVIEATPVGTVAVAPGQVSVRRDVPGDVTIESETAGPGFVVLTEGSDPGWRVTVDGRPAQLRHTNYLFQGVVVPEGRHTVRFYYLPSEFVASALASVGALLLGLVGLLFMGRRLRSRTADPQGA